jgi:hypothetical protein
MKAIVALALLAVVGFAVAGCGVTKKLGVKSLGPGPKVSFGSTMTVAQAAFLPIKTGTVIVCTGGRPRARVPVRGGAVNVGSDVLTRKGTVPASSRSLQIRHLESGWVFVTCSR